MGKVTIEESSGWYTKAWFRDHPKMEEWGLFRGGALVATIRVVPYAGGLKCWAEMAGLNRLFLAGRGQGSLEFERIQIEVASYVLDAPDLKTERNLRDAGYWLAAPRGGVWPDLGATPRVPIGAKDRNGVEICLGDTVRFADEREWRGPLPKPWVVALSGGELQQSAGVPSDLPHYCEVVPTEAQWAARIEAASRDPMRPM